MKLFYSHFDPRLIVKALDDINDKAPSYTLDKKSSLRRSFIVLATVAVCLLMMHYMKYSTTFHALLDILSVKQGMAKGYLTEKLYSLPFPNLINYAWWTFWQAIGYVLIPILIIKFILKESVIDMGWRWNETHKHWFGYVLLLAPILFCIFLVSFRSDFLNHYPFYKNAHRSWFDFLAWEFLYLAQFLSLEFFFRGFFVNALRPALGANAVWIMCVPYMMIHLPKLWLEATGAILFGLFLGILALRSRSIWGGFFVHAGVAVTMDVASILRQEKMPSVFWPL